MIHIKHGPNTTGIRSGYNSERPDSKGELFITVWPAIPQIEMWTTRGQNHVLDGDEAREFCAVLLTHMINPIMKGTV